MAARALSWLVFVSLMTGIVAGAIVVVICLYLPYVALKGVVQVVLGKARTKVVRASPGASTLHVG
jgi:hypothetical protein